MADENVNMADENDNIDRGDGEAQKPEKMFTLKKWNAVAMWSWDVECDTCAICRIQVMDACLRCQAENKQESSSAVGGGGTGVLSGGAGTGGSAVGVGSGGDCVVVWGECNHSFHYCCMSLWVKQNNRCPLCQQEWSIQRMGK
ncbi:RING-box protein 2 [Hetaerina americana]|uniref:RING-box protein 2 n=1 Tax=Hetaerina americana TaxID=62018 RepID=UPI003A7F4CAC